jgi:cell filamentation protein
MSDGYQYIDSKFAYIDPTSGILRNLPNLTDESDLLFFESSAVAKRIEELHSNPIKIINSDALLTIHYHLFQDVYEWAGKVRTVNISKDGKPFFDGERFHTGFRFIDSLINEYQEIGPASHSQNPIQQTRPQHRYCIAQKIHPVIIQPGHAFYQLSFRIID